MIETLLLITGAIVWAFIVVTAILWFAVVPAFALGYITYKTRRQLWIRDKCVRFIEWYTDHVLKPIYDPIIPHSMYT